MKKNYQVVFIKIVLLVVILSNFCVQAQGKEENSLPIIGENSADLSQMETWAKNSNATTAFVSLAKLYWNLSKAHGGIDPVVAYAQAAKETGYGRFGGVINESYHNTCGLKTSKGGGNYDSTAHQRFNSWEEGVSAHLDHLALYAGAEGYPRNVTNDPRHFSFLFGSVGNSVKNLGGKWAPNLNYGNDIIGMVKCIKATPSKNILVNKIVTDHTNAAVVTSDNTVSLSGQALSVKAEKEPKIYLDFMLCTMYCKTSIFSF